MKIGVISDLHGKCDKKVFEMLKGVSLILSLGDIEDENIIYDLSNIAKVISVRGNCDQSFSPALFPIEREIEIFNKKIFMSHILGLPDRKIDIYLYGHTHIAENRYENNVLYFNPGSTTNPRKGEKSIGILEISDNDNNVRGLIVEI